MLTLLPILLGLLMAALAVVILYQFTLGVKVVRSRREMQLAQIAGEVAPSAETTDLAREPTTLRDRLRAAGLDLGENAESKFTLLRIMLGGLGAGLVLAFGFPPLVGVIAAVLGYQLPQQWLNGAARRRMLQIEHELPEALGDIVALLRVAPSLRRALEETRSLLLKTNPRSPLAQELQWTLEDMAHGEEAAFKALMQRALSPALAMLAFSFAIFARSGGDYLDALEAQAKGVRRTLDARAKVQSEAAEATMSLKLIPALLAVVTLMFMQDPFFHAFYFTLGGQILLLATMGLMGLGYLIAQSMITEVA